MRRATLALLLLIAAVRAQTLDLGSMGAPEVGNASVFEERAQALNAEIDALVGITSHARDDEDASPLERDLLLADRARLRLRWLCQRLLRAEGSRNAAADHRCLVGLHLALAIPELDARLEAYEAHARLVHTDATHHHRAYLRDREALDAFLRISASSFGTVSEPKPLTFTIRGLEHALRPTLTELLPLLSDDQREELRSFWRGRHQEVGSTLGPIDDPAIEPVRTLLERAERALAYAPEARRLASIVRDAHGALATTAFLEPALSERTRSVFATHAEGLASPGCGPSSEARLMRIVAMGRLLEAIAPLLPEASRDEAEQLRGLAADFTRAALAEPGTVGTTDGELLEAVRIASHALGTAHARRSLEEPRRMQGDNRRSWLLMQHEQAERELSVVRVLREIAFAPHRVSSPSFVATVARAQLGYQRLLALRMTDDWLDELRDDGRMAILLGPTVSQRSRDLLIFELRARIRDAADREDRERALDDLDALRDRAARLGWHKIEQAFADGRPRWLGPERAQRLAQRLADTRDAWVDAWVDDDADAKQFHAEQLALLIRARDLVLLADRLERDDPRARSSSVPGVHWPDGEWLPLLQRVRGCASGAVHEALANNLTTIEDDSGTRTLVTTFEDRCDGARALVALAAVSPIAEAPQDPLVRLMLMNAVIIPGDHPARRHRYDIATFVRWVHELHGARDRDDRSLEHDILTYLDEVGADVAARVVED